MRIKLTILSLLLPVLGFSQVLNLDSIFHSTTSSTIALNGGNYILDSNLTINRAVNIYAVTGTGSVMVAGNYGILLENDSVAVVGLNFDSGYIRCWASDLTLRSDTLLNDHADAIAVNDTLGLTNITICSNYFNNITPYDSSSDVFNSSGRAVHVVGSEYNFNVDFTIDSNKIKNDYGGSDFMFTGGFTNLAINSNIIDSTAGQGVEMYRVTTNSQPVFINYNTILHTGILRDSAQAYGKIPSSVLTSGVGAGGIFANAYGGGGTFTYFTVNFNFIDSCYENGIEGSFGIVDSNWIKYTGNDLVGHYTPSPEGMYGPYQAIGNTIINPGGHGIYIFLYSGDTISDRNFQRNTITYNKTGTTPSTYSGITLNGVSNGIVLDTVTENTNTIYGFTNPFYLPHSNKPNNCSISGNIWGNCSNGIYQNSAAIAETNNYSCSRKGIIVNINL